MVQALPRVRVALLTLAVAVIAVVAGPAAPSSAHAELISSTPGDGATLAAAPAAVTLTFSDPIAAEFVRTAVTTPAGTATVTSGAKGPTVTVPVAAGGPGAYRVVYRVVSADGHPVSGQIRFTVAGAPTTTAPTVTPTTQAISPTTQAISPASTPLAAGDTPERDSGGPPWLVLAAVGAAIAAGLGAVVAATRGRRS